MKKVLVLVICMALVSLSLGAVAIAATPVFEITDQIKDATTAAQQAAMIAAVEAEYAAQIAAGFDPGTLVSDHHGKIHIWEDQAYRGIAIRFVDGDSTATAFSPDGPWYPIFPTTGWFELVNLTIIFIVENDSDGYDAFTLKNDSQDAAWWSVGFKDTGVAISNEFWTKDDNGDDVLVQNFDLGATYVYYSEGDVIDSGFEVGGFYEPPVVATPTPTPTLAPTQQPVQNETPTPGDSNSIFYIIIGIASIILIGFFARKKISSVFN